MKGRPNSGTNQKRGATCVPLDTNTCVAPVAVSSNSKDTLGAQGGLGVAVESVKSTPHR